MRRVLIIEDDRSVLGFIQQSLSSSGFEVLHVEACNQPDSAHGCDLHCYCDTVEPDVVIAAVISPRACSGIDIAEKVLRRWSGAKVLLISTTPVDLWPDDAITRLATLPHGRHSFLAKPFTTHTLGAAVAALAGISTSAARG